MNIVLRAAPAFKEGRTQNLSVCFQSPFLQKHLLHNFRLQEVVSAKCGISPQDHQKRDIGFPGHGQQSAGNGSVHLLCLLFSKASGIGKDIEQTAAVFKCLPERGNFPVGIDVYIVNRLNSSRIVVQDCDFKRLFISLEGLHAPFLHFIWLKLLPE